VTGCHGRCRISASQSCFAQGSDKTGVLCEGQRNCASALTVKCPSNRVGLSVNTVAVAGR
jgi:hypothetical protein